MSASGEYLSTLTLTDVHSGWTETRSLLNKAQYWVKEAASEIRASIPFALKGIDSDNGSEFKNTQLLAWCSLHSITFTRTRPYKKNDNCFVEQKNDSVVRRIVGYERFEGEDTQRVMNELYTNYDALVNYFFPSMKILSKEHIDAKMKKKYDAAKTPYTRLLECEQVDERSKTELKRRKSSLELNELLTRTRTLQKTLLALAVRRHT